MSATVNDRSWHADRELFLALNLGGSQGNDSVMIATVAYLPISNGIRVYYVYKEKAEKLDVLMVRCL